MDRIPVACPDLNGREQDYVLEAVKSSWISSSGQFLTRAERGLAEVAGTAQAIAVNSGTAALHLAFLALGVGPGDEVVVPSLTYVSSVNAVRYVGATPVFVDVDPDSWCLDPHAVCAALTTRTRAVLAVHLYGQPADMDAIDALCRPRGIRIVEDAAEAPLAAYRGRPVGSLGDVSAFSFFGNKILSCGEGGAVALDDPEAADHVRRLRNQGMDPERRYWFPELGYNYRLTNVAAAILCAQLERRDELLAARRRLFTAYEERLAGVPGLEVQRDLPGRTRSPWMFSILVDEAEFGCSRDAVMTGLALRGVETRPFFPPVHELPIYTVEGQGLDLPVTGRLSASGLNLPTYVGLSERQLDTVCAGLLSLGGSGG